eukprot:TRINITY_DN11803_c1_g1_i1.p1 TRINITY_DN11803_c1_g1~~TRINITY_DN11803_c1_g1_i1.p1  ORF type:complete len:177 (+),score=26.95 TRINITY_DN11803_c1_g1_i1:77-607(+)
MDTYNVVGAAPMQDQGLDISRHMHLDNILKSAVLPAQVKHHTGVSLEDMERTIHLRGLPVRCRQDEVLSTLEKLGFGVDAVASMGMPLRPSRPGKNHHNRGYCFVHFHSSQQAELFLESVQNGFTILTRSDKLVTAERAHGCGQHCQAYQSYQQLALHLPEGAESSSSEQGEWLRL